MCLYGMFDFFCHTNMVRKKPNLFNRFTLKRMMYNKLNAKKFTIIQWDVRKWLSGFAVTFRTDSNLKKLLFELRWNSWEEKWNDIQKNIEGPLAAQEHFAASHYSTFCWHLQTLHRVISVIIGESNWNSIKICNKWKKFFHLFSWKLTYPWFNLNAQSNRRKIPFKHTNTTKQ